jgi:hypothetical protein
VRGALVAASLLLASTASAQPVTPLAPLQFLVGDWRAVDTPAGETGRFTFKFDVQGHVLVRTNEAVSPTSRHDDLMVIHVEGDAVKADYFDNEGHVIRYTARIAANRVTFTSDPDPKEPRYRLSYALAPDGVLSGAFEIAMPDAPDAFKPYLAWKARKQP